MEEFELVVPEEYKLEKGAEEKSTVSWKFRTVKTLMQRTQIDNSPIENLSTSRTFPMPTLIGEIQHVVLVKFEFEYREKLKLQSFFWKFQDSDAIKNNNDFLVEYSSTSAAFLCEILMEGIELMVSQN